MSVLFWTLLLSITLFITGLLIQLWALAFSCDKPAFVLITAAALGTALSILILGIILAATYHAVIHQNSPFESPLSTALRPAAGWLNARKAKKSLDLELSADDESAGRPTKDTSPIEDLMEVSIVDNDNIQAIKTYACLVINTNDTEVLERAAPSFEFSQWVDVWDDMQSVFEAVRGRFLTTDTSIRVKETVHNQLVHFKDWPGWRMPETSSGCRRDLQVTGMTQWCKEECGRLIWRGHDSYVQFFPAWVFFTSFEEGNHDLRSKYYDPDSCETCVHRVLSSYNYNRTLGHRRELFYAAVLKFAAVRLRLPSDSRSPMNLIGPFRASVIQSFIRNPGMPWSFFTDIATLITKDNEVTVLVELAPFLSNLSGRMLRGGPECLVKFLAGLVPSFPPDFKVPQSFDLSPALAVFIEQRGELETADIRVASSTFMYLLEHGGFHNVSKLEPVLAFFELCIGDNDVSDPTVNILQERSRWHLNASRALFIGMGLVPGFLFVLLMSFLLRPP